MKLVHRNQTIDTEGNVAGDLPDTDTLGFRWSAVNNLFWTASEIAVDEHKASRSADEENDERAMRQYIWCLPAVPLKLDQTTLEIHAITNRVGRWQRGV
ncbi:MAG: hypothetical protein WD176_03055, partial [Pirellulales bacterium]